jgi:hypothetical protein
MKTYFFCFLFLCAHSYAGDFCSLKHLSQLQNEVESLPLFLPQEQRHVMFSFVNTINSKVLPAFAPVSTGTLSEECQKILITEWVHELTAISHEPTASAPKFVGKACNLLGLLQYHIKEQEITESLKKNVQG